MRDFEILTHLNIYEEKKNQRPPPTVEPEYTEPVIVPFDDGWPEYEEAAFEFKKMTHSSMEMSVKKQQKREGKGSIFP